MAQSRAPSTVSKEATQNRVSDTYLCPPVQNTEGTQPAPHAPDTWEGSSLAWITSSIKDEGFGGLARLLT